MDFDVNKCDQPDLRVLRIPVKQTAEEALADLYRTLSPEAAKGWLEDARRGHALLEDGLVGDS